METNKPVWKSNEYYDMETGEKITARAARKNYQVGKPNKTTENKGYAIIIRSTYGCSKRQLRLF